MFLQGPLRYYISILLKSEPAVNIETLRANQLLKRSARLRALSQYIPLSAFRMRKHFLVKSDKGLSGKAPEQVHNFVPCAGHFTNI